MTKLCKTFLYCQIIEINYLHIINSIEYNKIIMIIPNAEAKIRILEDFNDEMNSYVHGNLETNELEPIFCASCDCIQTHDNKMKMIEIDEFADLCNKCNMDACRLEPFYPSTLLNSYRIQNDKRLCNYVLSPSTLIDKNNDTTRVCNACYSTLKKEVNKKNKS